MSVDVGLAGTLLLTAGGSLGFEPDDLFVQLGATHLDALALGHYVVSEKAVETIRRLRRRGGNGGSGFVRRRAPHWERRHHEKQDGGLDHSIHIHILSLT